MSVPWWMWAAVVVFAGPFWIDFIAEVVVPYWRDLVVWAALGVALYVVCTGGI